MTKANNGNNDSSVFEKKLMCIEGFVTLTLGQVMWGFSEAVKQSKAYERELI